MDSALDPKRASQTDLDTAQFPISGRDVVGDVLKMAIGEKKLLEMDVAAKFFCSGKSAVASDHWAIFLARTGSTICSAMPNAPVFPTVCSITIN